MKKITIAIFLSFFNGIVLADGLSINNAKLCDGGATPRTEAEINAGQAFGVVLKNAGIDINKCLAYTNAGSGSAWYDLDSDMKIYAVNVETKQLLGDWSLAWWPETYIDSSLKERLAQNNIALEYTWSNDSAGDVGCLTQKPLRYGDLTGDAQPQLVVLSNAQLFSVLDFTLFSPTSQKIIFSARLAGNEAEPNYLRELEQGEEATPYKLSKLANKPTDPQYLSAAYDQETYKNMTVAPGLVSYAKIYIDDFNNDNRKDIVLWNKSYESRTLGDSVKGFTKKADMLIHYTFINGSFKKQATESTEVKAWLASKNLTWSKGYPNKSECAGQTNQLIPEMHDPLLNDPEVLQ
jgi:hypothetical protein